ncbi:hypothetical protein BH10PSE19_BH10PSE19_07280 [soil metagenome]
MLEAGNIKSVKSSNMYSGLCRINRSIFFASVLLLIPLLSACGVDRFHDLNNHPPYRYFTCP